MVNSMVNSILGKKNLVLILSLHFAILGSVNAQSPNREIIDLPKIAPLSFQTLPAKNPMGTQETFLVQIQNLSCDEATFGIGATRCGYGPVLALINGTLRKGQWWTENQSIWDCTPESRILMWLPMLHSTNDDLNTKYSDFFENLFLKGDTENFNSFFTVDQWVRKPYEGYDPHREFEDFHYPLERQLLQNNKLSLKNTSAEKTSAKCENSPELN